MKEKRINKHTVEVFKQFLILEEKSSSTISKYVHDTINFLNYLGKEPLTKERVIGYKEYLQEHYRARSVNTMLASLNCFFNWIDRPELRVKQLKIQQQAFCPDKMELTRKEYIRLVNTARTVGNRRMEMVLQAICCTGIRVGELNFITVKAVRQGCAEVCCKGKNRRIMIPGDLRKKLLFYIRQMGIERGEVFITKTGKAMDRSNIWREMKSLAAAAGVYAEKVFPHNLRHLFARSFYEIHKDIVRLADVMGHSSISTTRIYMISTGKEHQRQLDLLRLVVCDGTT